MKRAQGLEEPLLSYYFDILETCQNVDPATPKERKVGHLLNGLKPTLAEKIKPYEVKSCKEFLECAKLLVRATEAANAPGRNQAIVAAAQAKIDCEPKPLIDNAENDTNLPDDSIKSILKSLLEQQASLLAHASARRPDPKPEPTPETNLVQQLKNLFVHQPAAPQTDEEIIIDGIRKMLQRQNNPRGNGRGRGRGGRGSYNSNHTGNTHTDAACHYCKKSGHIQRFCPQRKEDYIKSRANKEKEKPPSIRLVNTNGAPEPAKIGQITTGPLVIQQVVCNGLEINAIIDTGASLSAISPVLLKRFNSEGKTYNGPLLIMASGQEIKPEKEFDIIIEHPSGATAKATVAVLELTGEHLLLGNDILRQFHKITVEFKDNDTATLLLNIQVKNSPETQPKPQLIAKEACQVPGRSIKAVPIFGIRVSKSNAVAMIEPAQELAIKKGISPRHALINGDDTTKTNGSEKELLWAQLRK